MNGIKESNQKSVKYAHNLTLENRKTLIISGVTDVGNFDDKSITASTDVGELAIKGENLNIKKLSLELGDLEVEGKVSSLSYTNKNFGASQGFFSKLFK